MGTTQSKAKIVKPDITTQCKEPWLFWWLLLPKEERIALKDKYYPKSFPNWKGSLLDPEKQIVWEQEKPEPLSAEDWIILATIAINNFRHTISPKEQVEIWRQVYRIASERI